MQPGLSFPLRLPSCLPWKPHPRHHGDTGHSDHNHIMTALSWLRNQGWSPSHLTSSPLLFLQSG